MKRFGYTLAEVLIAIAIVGIVAGLLLPLANKFKPDTNKMMFLKTYDSIAHVTQVLMNNDAYYPKFDKIKNDDENIYSYEQFPLANIEKTSIDGTGYKGASKYCDLLALALNGENINCSDGIIPPFQDNTKSFTTPNGIDFWVSVIYSDYNPENNPGEFLTIINFDLNGLNNGVNCTYNDINCIQPDRFALTVTADGNIVAQDKKSQDFLANRNNYKLSKEKSKYDNQDPIGSFKLAKLNSTSSSQEPPQGPPQAPPQGPPQEPSNPHKGGGGSCFSTVDNLPNVCYNSYTTAGTTVTWYGSCDINSKYIHEDRLAVFSAVPCR